MTKKTGKKQNGRSSLPAALLLYGIDEGGSHDRTLTKLAKNDDLRLIRAAGADLTKPVMEILELGTVSVCTKPYEGPELKTPFLLMVGLNAQKQDHVLTGLRNAGTPIDLKAVLTDTNKKWSLGALIREVAREHLSMQRKVK